jgi:hypothetical protein
MKRFANHDGVIIFPGIDVRRDTELKQFLTRPIDSRDPFTVPEPPKTSYGMGIRSSEPTESVKREWDSRLNRVRVRSRMAMRRPIARGIPDIATRDLANVPDIWNPFCCPTVEEVIGERSTQPQGPMFAYSRLPRLRGVPTEYRVAKIPR